VARGKKGLHWRRESPILSPMPNIDKHKPGSFSWIELSTSDQKAANNFYTSLFGWSVQDHPMGPNEVYSIYQIKGRDVGAACTLRPEQSSHGVPPHWMIYITVGNADASAALGGKLGGKVLAPAFDVMDLGRMAVLQDPTGASFSIWQANQKSGTTIVGEDGAFCWADLSTPDQAAASKFYSGLFGWKLTAGVNDSSGYLHIQNGEDYIGGVPHGKHRDPHLPAHWLAYIQVANCDATAAKAKQLGAKFYLEPTSMENVGRFAILADPQGAVIAIFQPAPRK